MFCNCLSCCSTFPVSSNGDHPDSEIVVSVHGDASKQEEEEIRRKILTLEYQRRIEDEAKKKYLAEQHKKAKGTIPEKHGDDDQDVHKQLKHCKQVSIIVLFSYVVGTT